MFPAVVKLIKTKICSRSKFWDCFDLLTYTRCDSSVKLNCSKYCKKKKYYCYYYYCVFSVPVLLYLLLVILWYYINKTLFVGLIILFLSNPIVLLKQPFGGNRRLLHLFLLPQFAFLSSMLFNILLHTFMFFPHHPSGQQRGAVMTLALRGWGG